MSSTAFGVDRWFGSWESAQNVGCMLRAMEWHVENARERGWVKVYSASSPGSDADGTRDLLTWDRTVADRLMSGGVSAAAYLAAIEANTSDFPASGTSVVTAIDETIVIPGAAAVYTSWFDVSPYVAFRLFVSNTGANPTVNCVYAFASGAAGAGLVGWRLLAYALAAGATDSLDYVSSTMPPSDVMSTSRQPMSCGSMRIGFCAAAGLGTTVRIIVIGRKPWAKD